MRTLVLVCVLVLASCSGDPEPPRGLMSLENIRAWLVEAERLHNEITVPWREWQRQGKSEHDPNLVAKLSKQFGLDTEQVGELLSDASFRIYADPLRESPRSLFATYQMERWAWSLIRQFGDLRDEHAIERARHRELGAACFQLWTRINEHLELLLAQTDRQLGTLSVTGKNVLSRVQH